MKCRHPAVALAAISTLLTGGASFVRAQSVESMLPAHTVVYMGTNDVDALVKATKTTALGKILGEEEVRDFLKKPLGLIHAELQKGVDALKAAEPAAAELSIDPMTILNGPYGRAFLAITHFELPSPPKEGEKMGKPDIGLVVGLEPRAGAVDLIGLMKTLLLAQLKSSQEEVALETLTTETGISYERIQCKSNGPPLVFANVGGLRLFSLSEKALLQVMSLTGGVGESLAETPFYREAMEVAGIGGAGAPRMFFDVAAIFRFGMSALDLAAQEKQEEASIALGMKAALQSLGIDKIGPIFASSGWENGVAISRNYLRIQPGATGVAKAVGGRQAVDLKLLNLVPETSTGFSMSYFDLAPIYSALMNVLAQTVPEMHEKITTTIQQFAASVSGVDEQGKPNWDLERDFIQALGGEVFSMSIPGKMTMMGPGTDRVGWIETSNPQGLAKSIEYIAALPAQFTGSQLVFKEEMHGNIKLKVLDPMSLGPAAMVAATLSPTYAIHEGKMYYSTDKQALKRMLDARSNPPEKTIKTRPDFARHFQHVRQDAVITGLSYSDTAAGFDGGYTMLMGVIPMLLMSAPIDDGELPVELSMLPTAEAISQHLFGTMGVSYRLQDNSILSESYGPFGAELGLALAGCAAGGLAFLGLSAKHEAALSALDAELEAVEAAPEGDPKDTALADLNHLKASVTVYIIYFGKVPASLGALAEPSEDYPQGVLQGAAVPQDPWGNAYRYALKGDDGFAIWSLGPDGLNQDGQGDDVMVSR